jgi:hypothetical protein
MSDLLIAAAAGGGCRCVDAGHKAQRDVRTPAVMNGRQTGGTIIWANIQMEAWNGRTHELPLNDVILCTLMHMIGGKPRLESSDDVISDFHHVSDVRCLHGPADHPK